MEMNFFKLVVLSSTGVAFWLHFYCLCSCVSWLITTELDQMNYIQFWALPELCKSAESKSYQNSWADERFEL